MAVVAKFDSVGLANGTVITPSTAGPGDTSFSAINGAAPVVSATGTRSPRLQFDHVAGGNAFVSWDSAKLGGTLGQLGVRVYVDVTAWASASWTILSLYQDASQVLRVDFSGPGTGAGKLRIRDGAGVQLGESPLGLAAATAYRLEVTYNAGATTATAYAGESTTPYTTVSGTVAGVTVNKINIGPIASSPTVPRFYLDDVLAQNIATEGGPAATPPDPTLSIWTGAEEIYLIGAP